MNGYCVCLVFLTPDALGRVERYESCPRHWRLFEDQFEIPRDSSPVELDTFLELVDA